MSGTAALALQGVSCTFVSKDDASQRYTAVRDVTLTVGAGEFVSVVGPTGCGKSTLLNVAAGLLRPARARCRSSASRCGHQPARRLHVPGREPDALAHRAGQRDGGAGVPRCARCAARAEEWLRRVGLGGFGDRYPHQLSGGMRKRTSLAQTLALDPDIILMDEPFSALDIQTRQLMENEVLELWAAEAKAVLFITHDLDEAIAMSDRVVVLSAGPASHPIGDFASTSRVRATSPRSRPRSTSSSCTPPSGPCCATRCSRATRSNCRSRRHDDVAAAQAPPGNLRCGSRLLAALVGFWYLMTTPGLVPNFMFDNDRQAAFFFGEPVKVAQRIWAWFVAEADIYRHLAVTLVETLLAFGVGSVLGLGAGLWLALSPMASAILEPYIKALNSMPRIILAPIFSVWFGLGIASKVALGVTLVFFIVFFNVYQGVKEVSPVVLANARMLGASNRQLLRHVYLPSATSWVFSSLHTSVGLAFVGAVVGEYLGVSQGVGYLILQAEGTFDINTVMAGIVVLTVFALVLDAAVGKVEKRLMKWQPRLATAATRLHRPQGSAARVLDGPFAEAREMIGGFFLLDVATRDDALAWAARCPAAAWATVEVRETGPCFL
jgi:NitT/TauT family transport system permease protein